MNNQQIDLSQIDSEQEVVNLLENISQNISPEQIEQMEQFQQQIQQQPQQVEQPHEEIKYQDARAKIFEKNDDFEVIEIVEDSSSDNSSQPAKSGKKVKPNDPCPCGSGKKYKKCCGKNNI